METEKRRAFIINFLYFAIILGLVIFFCRFALPTVLPFVIAFVVSVVLKPVITFLKEKCRVNKGVASIVIVLLFYAVIAFLLTAVGIKAFSTAKDFFIGLPRLFSTTIQPALVNFFNAVERLVAYVNPEASSVYNTIEQNVTQTLASYVSALSGRVVGGVTSMTFRAPGWLLNVLITIIATVFISVDWSVLSEFILRQCSDKTRSMLDNIRTHLGRTLGSYIRSYALILVITFAELAIGLSIIGVDGAFGIAALIAVFDILPVVGSGAVLIPWTIICLVRANYLRALGLGILYIVLVIVRNIIEPKIIGERVGLHPIVTLSSMVVGTYVFGPIGLLGLPVTLALLQSLNADGVIHLFKRKPQVPDEENDADGTDANDASGADGEAPEQIGD